MGLRRSFKLGTPLLQINYIRSNFIDTPVPYMLEVLLELWLVLRQSQGQGDE